MSVVPIGGGAAGGSLAAPEPPRYAPRAPEPGAGLAVYVHWPFCQAKCPYCDFNSHVRFTPPDEARYARAFRAEIAHMAALAPGRRVTSIFLGGGTPSLMQPATVAAVLDAVAAAWPVDPAAEITLEANPTSVEAGRFRGYRAAGVNRVSLGVQALRDDALKALGRLHTAAEALAAVDLATAIFARVSFDLIYARPGQTLGAWEAELGEALARGPGHLSLYGLTFEEGTPFEALRRAGRITPLGLDACADMFELTQGLAAGAGLPAYEVSNHARPGSESRHNLTYWRYGEYAGVGPGAHGRLEMRRGRLATATERAPEAWLAGVEARGHGLATQDLLTPEEAGDECLLMGLRLTEGLDPEHFADHAARSLDPGRIALLVGDGLLERTPEGRLRATPGGTLVLDALVADLAA